MDDLDRLYTRLAATIRERTASSGTHACSIAEIYQNLIPYRGVRTELGFGELPRYEHTLLRLLSGERGYIAIDLPRVTDEFRSELESTNPILGIYRDYAAVGVHVRLNGADGGEGTEEGTAEAGLAGPAMPGPVGASPAPPPEVDPAPPAPAVSPAPAPTESAEHCPQCGERLPRGREARFCPFCGTGLRPAPCGSCGREMEPAWNFCVHCGTPNPARTPRGTGE